MKQLKVPPVQQSPFSSVIDHPDYLETELKFFNAPIALIWEITEKCACCCKYCSGGFPQRTGEMTRAEKLQLAEELVAARIFAINLSGGEPFLCDDVITLANTFLTNGIMVNLCTTGFNITPEKIKDLSNTENLAFNFSVDSIDPRINDSIRGAGALNAALHAIDLICNLSENRIPISVETVITRENYRGLDELIAFFKDRHIFELRFQSVVLTGRGQQHRELALPLQEIDKIKKKLEKLNQRNLHAYQNKRNRNMVFINFVNQAHTVSNGARVGRNWGGIITPDGSVKVSAYLPFFFGNLRAAGSFRALWDKGFKTAWHHPVVLEAIKGIKTIKDLEEIHAKYLNTDLNL